MDKENKNNVIDHPLRYAHPVSAEAVESKKKKPNYMLRRIGAGAAAAITLAATGAVTKASMDYLHSDPNQATSGQEAVAFASSAGSATVEFGKSNTDWGHGAAEKAIQAALIEGLSQVSIDTAEPGTHEALDIKEIVDSIPVYDQAETVLERAHYNEMVPDPGDKLTVDLMVSVDSHDNISYEITGAEIHDIVNNQG